MKEIKGMKGIDLTRMPTGKRYEDTYGKYLDIFHEVATSPYKILVRKPPKSWIPLLLYLGAKVEGSQHYFKHDSFIIFPTHDMENLREGMDRTYVEVMCGFRPETADALWKSDMEWLCCNNRLDFKKEKEFIITSNGSFHRYEVLDFMTELDRHHSSKDRCVIVPCAADKPYPSPLHKDVMKLFPNNKWHLCIATGVLGIVPQEMWTKMPHYDSGIPNEWRLMTRATEYFTNNVYKHIVCYTDFYNLSLYSAFRMLAILHKVTFVLPVRFYHNYMPLRDKKYLSLLKNAILSAEERVKLSGVLEDGPC